MNDALKKHKRLFPWGKRTEETAVPLQEVSAGWTGWQGWLRIVLVFLTLEMAVLSIEQAHWIDPQPSLSLVLFLAVLTSLVLVKIPLFGFIKFVLALAIGVVVTVWQAMNVLTVPETTSRLAHFLDVVAGWWRGSAALMPGDDKIVFVIFITFLTWVIGCLSLWFVLRWNNSWVGVILGGLVVLFNLSNLPDSYYIYFFLYFFAAALLLAVTRMTGQSLKLGHTANYSGKSLLYLGISLLCIVAIAASFSWITPQVRATGLQDFIATKLPWQRDILESKFNVFNTVASKQAVSTSSTLKDMAFKETWNQGDEVEYIIYSERPSYWRINVYDTYTSDGWTHGLKEEILLEADTPWVNPEGVSGREIMTYSVNTEIFTDVVLTNGGFISSNIPVKVNVDARGDVETINAVRILNPGESYEIETWVVSDEAGVLSGAGEQYPESITYTYLQLPPDIAYDIRQLTGNITHSAVTPYAKVMAIVDYLSQFPYKLEIDAPPEDADSVTYFLFDRQSGYCLHFASAAVVMLRSIDIPARLAVGYLPGEPGDIPGQYIVRDKFYHTWPQVYFPDYGWVDIEATPSDTASQVTVETPWVSSASIEQSQYYDYLWRGAMIPDIGNISDIGIEHMPGGGVVDGEADSLSFADKLGLALLFVLAAALIIAIIVVLILFIKSLSFRWLWRVDRKALAYDTYVNMCRLASMTGLVPSPQQTPLEFTENLARIYPQQAEALDFITRAYLNGRFGGRGGKPALAEEAEILKARHIVYNTLLRRLGLVKRIFGQR